MSIKLHQIILFCANVERLAQFYSEKLQLEIEGSVNAGWTVLRAGEVAIGLHKIPEEYLGMPVDQFQIQNSNVKLVLEVDSGLRQLREKLASAGIDIGEIRSFEGYPFDLCDGKDPEGNVFQLIQRK